MRSTLALVLILFAVALGFLHGAISFSRDREAALAALDDFGASSGGSAAAPAASSTSAPPPSSASASTSSSSSGAAGAAMRRPAAGTPASSAPPPAAASASAPAPKERDLTEEEIAAVKALLASGDERRKAGEYKGSKDAYAEAGKKLLGMRSVVALPLARVAQKGEAKAEVLGALAAAVPPNDFASGEGLRKLYLKSGREYVAKILSLAGGQVSFKLANGIEIALPLGELAKPSEPCARTEWRERCAKGLEERRGKTDEDSAFELFRLAAFALENGLKEEAAPILERALEKDKPGLLPEYFCDAERRPSRTTVQLARGGTEAEVAEAVRKTGPASGAGAPASGSDDEPEAAPAAPRPQDGKLFSDARWKKAMAAQEQAIAHYRKSFRGTPDYEKELKAALAGFNEVATVLDEMRGDFPDSATLEAKAVEVNQARVDCRKRSAM